MIETQDLTKQYNGVTVLNLPNLKIKAGESFGLVGNNGAGKTTFFSLALDLIEATAGEVRSQGKAVKQSEHW
jgi:ABC-2 type transport system ATP-binding protein